MCMYSEQHHLENSASKCSTIKYDVYDSILINRIKLVIGVEDPFGADSGSVFQAQAQFSCVQN